MLPASNRLRRSDDFRHAIRSGQRAGRRTVVVHLLTGSGDEQPLVGFVVSRAVGGAVRRNLVQRRLRSILAAHLDRLPPGSMTVVRALPVSGSASYADLSADVTSGLRRLGVAR